MAWISFDMQGLDALLKDLNNVPEAAVKEIENGLDRAADLVLSLMKSAVSVDTGKLQKSLKKRKPKKSRKNSDYVYSSVALGKAHGVPLELGHRLISHGKTVGIVKEHPFMRPAFDQSIDQVEGILADSFNKVIDMLGG